jgi:lysophospholipase L1-like esterase
MRALFCCLLAVGLAAAATATAAPGGTIVAFGDSITKGNPDPWPEVLQARLRQRFPTLTVINAGVPGNRLLHGDASNPSGLSRFVHDALDPPDVRIVILLEGTNDIGWLGNPHSAGDVVSAQEIIAADRELIARAHERHVKIYGGTLPPFAGAAYPGYYSPEGEAMRAAVNRWIRTGGAFDAVIDFDAALRDPADPKRLRPDCDSGDHLHPSRAGEAAMAAAIDLALFE